ncbi:MAG TPA: AlpA family phage regulatory protein [Nitrospirota bacterium]|nr:AlpA family phage regulatory protein [Nitrospirota bacterium]
MVFIMDDYIMNKKAVVSTTGRSATSLWRDVQAGTFPAPRKIGPGRIGWLASEVQNWLETLPLVETKKRNKKKG